MTEERVNNMHFQFLIEDMSGGILIKQVMDKLIAMRTDITCENISRNWRF